MPIQSIYSDAYSLFGRYVAVIHLVAGLDIQASQLNQLRRYVKSYFKNRVVMAAHVDALGISSFSYAALILV